MKDSTKRFSNRVENYIKYRPHYPKEIVETLQLECGLRTDSIIADQGSGTGILTALFLQSGCRVLALESNREMREAGERWLKGYDGFTSLVGMAEGLRVSLSLRRSASIGRSSYRDSVPFGHSTAAARA